MQITYKFRLYPNKQQENRLVWTLEKCRLVYNDMLEILRKQNKPDKSAVQSILPKLKEQYPELKGVYSKTLQYECYKLFSNLKGLGQLKKKGRRVGKLRFKGKGWFKTFTYNQSGFKIIETKNRHDKLHLSKIGDIPIMIHREIEGSIKQIVVKRYCSGKWYASIITERDNNNPETSKITNIIGIDKGIKHFLSDSDGRQIENPRFLKKGLKKLRRKQRKLSRTKKQSNNRNKARIKLATLHEQIRNQRLDFLHKLSCIYVDKYDMVAIENLNIKGMVRNHRLARSISDVGWSTFDNMLSYKAENAGKIVVKVDPKGTSQEYNYGDIDRDYNASINILIRGIEKILPQGLRENTPMEIEPLRKLEIVSASLVIEIGSPSLDIRQMSDA